jgi:hypothetical protein
MELANASLLDEATAAAEAMAMLKRVNRKNKSNVFLVDANCLPQTIDVVANRGRHLDLEVRMCDDLSPTWPKPTASAFSSSTPAATARCRTGRPGRKGPRKGALAAVAADLMALVLLKSPGEGRCRLRGRFGPALWRTHGLRRPACGLLRHPRGLSTQRTGPHHRRVEGPPRQPGPAHGPADPRAAYPSRKGDEQHLHRPGPAGGDGRLLRRLARPRRPEEDRRAHPPPCLHAWPCPAVAGFELEHDHFSTPCRCASTNRNARPCCTAPSRPA